jgi:SAM-dependent methyltransferase
VLQFNRHAEAYDAIRARIAYPEGLYQRLARSCPRQGAALDVGCGNGASTLPLLPHFAHVEGIDIGANLVEKARARAPSVPFTVAAAESFISARRFDLVTCATAFYWMDRDVVLGRCADWLDDDGVFCAYRYDFPIVLGPVRDVVERELVEHWAAHRDGRLIAYDDTRERLARHPAFVDAERFVEPNILTLRARELALFFLSTSYVTRFLEHCRDADAYAAGFAERVDRAAGDDAVFVNFDIHAFRARRRRR